MIVRFGVFFFLESALFAVVASSKVAEPLVHIYFPETGVAEGAFLLAQQPLADLALVDDILDAAFEQEHHVPAIPDELLPVDADLGEVAVDLSLEIAH